MCFRHRIFRTKKQLIKENQDLLEMIIELTNKVQKQAEIIKAVEEICESCADLLPEYTEGDSND